MNGDIQEMMDAVIMAENAEKMKGQGNLTFINLIYRINNKKSRSFLDFYFDYLVKANGIS